MGKPGEDGQGGLAAPLIRSAATVAACLLAVVPQSVAANDVTELVIHLKHRVEIFPDRIQGPLPPNARNVRVEVYSQPAKNPSCGVERRTYFDGPHVGVVLSGGVSKGLAAIGALKFLDEAGIRVDGIVGTSMGAVVASLYAAGYSPDTIYTKHDAPVVFAPRKPRFSVLDQVDWRLIFTDIPPESTLTYNKLNAWGLGEGNNFLPRAYQGGLKSGQNVVTFLNKVLLPATAASNGCFDNLYVPFRAVASNILDAKATYFDRGSVANAVRASLAFPAVFTPVFIGGVRYRDGGLMRNYPLDGIDHFSAKPAQATAGAGADVSLKKFNVTIGFDVSDTKVPPLEEASLFPIRSIYDALLGVGDGLSAAITRETELQKHREHKACASIADIVPPAGAKPCLIDVKIDVEGGFLDFNWKKFNEFFDKGYASAQSRLCGFFKVGSQCKPEALRAAIEKDEKARTLLFDPEVNLKSALENVAETKPASAAGLPARLEAFLGAYRRAADTLEVGPMSADLASDGTLQELVIRYRHDAVFAFADPVILGDKPLRARMLKDLETILYWLAKTASGVKVDPDRVLGQYFREFSSLRVIVAPDEILVRASSWRYEMNKLALLSDFTERDALEQASVALWNYEPEDVARLKSRIEDDYAGTLGLDIAQSGTGLGVSKKGGDHAVPERRRLKTELYEGLAGRKLDVRYFASAKSCDESAGGSAAAPVCSLAELTVRQINRYYSIGSTEYVRVEDISKDSMLLAEKRNMESPWGSLYANYQYDFDNKHTYILKHSKFSRDSRFHALTNVAVNDPTGDPAGMRYLDTTVTYFHSIDPGALPSDASVNPYLAHRVVRLPSDDRPRRLDYNARGIKVTLSTAADMAGARAAGTPETLGATGFAQAEWRSLSRISSDDMPFVSAELHDPGLRSDESRRHVSYRAGVQYYAARFVKPFRMGVAYHKAATGNLWEVFLKLNLQAGPVELIMLGGRIGDKWSLKGGSVEASTPAPIDELYSVGGFYPLREDRFWGAKRLDYIGADLNEHWGTSAFYSSFRFDLCQFAFCESLRGMSLFSPNSKFRFDLVIDLAQVGFSAEDFKQTQVAKGLSFSAYLPVVTSLQPKFNVAVGGESRRNIKFFSSVDIVF